MTLIDRVLLENKALWQEDIEITPQIRAQYSKYVTDRSHDAQLDSDEKVWVDALRKEKKEVKPWSVAEQKRTEEASKMVHSYLYAGEDKEFMEFYDTDGEEVYTQKLGKEYGTRDNVEAVIMKEWFIYKHNWDENDNRVKKGKRVPGSIFYTVAIDGEVIDENVAGYKTEADARHALEITLDWMKNRTLKS